MWRKTSEGKIIKFKKKSGKSQKRTFEKHLKSQGAQYLYSSIYLSNVGFPGGSVVKNPPANAGDVGSVPG